MLGRVDPRKAYLIRKSFAVVEARGSLAALVFYRRLFEAFPSVRPLFKNDIEEQAKKLTDMLASLISLLDRGGALMAELHEMGARHATYGVKDAHYPAVGQALMEMLDEVLGKDFTPEVREAWSELYAAVVTAMRDGAAAAGAAPTAP